MKYCFREEKIEKHLEETSKYAGEYDELEMDYRGLWTTDDIILAQIEGHFEHKFHAKGFLSDIVVVRCTIHTKLKMTSLKCDRIPTERARSMWIRFLQRSWRNCIICSVSWMKVGRLRWRI